MASAISGERLPILFKCRTKVIECIYELGSAFVARFEVAGAGRAQLADSHFQLVKSEFDTYECGGLVLLKHVQFFRVRQYPLSQFGQLVSKGFRPLRDDTIPICRTNILDECRVFSEKDKQVLIYANSHAPGVLTLLRLPQKERATDGTGCSNDCTKKGKDRIGQLPSLWLPNQKSQEETKRERHKRGAISYQRSRYLVHATPYRIRVRQRVAGGVSLRHCHTDFVMAA